MLEGRRKFLRVGLHHCTLKFLRVIVKVRKYERVLVICVGLIRYRRGIFRKRIKEKRLEEKKKGEERRMYFRENYFR